MQTITTIGLDIAKVFQVHGVDAVGQMVIGRQLKNANRRRDKGIAAASARMNLAHFLAQTSMI